MHIATATLKSASPYSQSKHISEKKPDKETPRDFEARTWRQRLHVGPDGRVYIPSMAFKNCLSEAAKYLALQVPGKGKTTYTKHIEAGVLCVDHLQLPIKATDVDGEWLFLPADGRRGSGKRVDKCYPLIREWSGEIAFHILDDAVTQDVFSTILQQAGAFIGIGRFRPRNNGFYGRFTVEKVKWQ